MGATPHHDGTRFVVFSRNAACLTLLLFENPEDTEPAVEFQLNDSQHRFGDIWSVYVKGVRHGCLYAWRAHGNWNPSSGHRFNSDAQLIDPYARGICGPYEWREQEIDESVPLVPKSLVTHPPYHWKRTAASYIPMEDTVIYEVHLKGFTAHPSSETHGRGAINRFIEKIPYLRNLGITTVEFLPVQSFAENENINRNPFTGERLKNYWGYSTIGFMAVHPPYGSMDERGSELSEFRNLVNILHENGLEVILDIVFNHTAEGNETGPTLSFRGLDNSIYYMLGEDQSTYRNFSGCGNTVNCNHPVVRDFILDVLRYWVVEIGVDGFRFDLASILGRDQNGELLDNPPLVERIAEDPILRSVKIIAEAWDAGGAYQVGSFPGTRWSEWNGKFRDDIRKFWLTGEGNIRDLAMRLSGSEDLYGHSGRTPLHSINFITSHDGFSLRDLVSYDFKHNENNGEKNRDGENHNISNNHGVEGPSDDLKIRKNRLISMKNLLTTLFISQGVPMISSGDEIGHTKSGNNNSYCQDNPVNWFDWRRFSGVLDISQQGYEDPDENDISEAAQLYSLIRALIELRKSNEILRRKIFFRGIPVKTVGDVIMVPDVYWHDENHNDINWHRNDNFLGVLLGTDFELFPSSTPIEMLFNGTGEDKNINLKMVDGFNWVKIIDTSCDEILPLDLFENGTPLDDFSLVVKSRSTVILMLKKTI
ncbi:MAG: glycogen debranching protein GlgX [Deltaproteobacteria bacterium]|nr:glycogen debranching protein GlgX [Deltaproteobacteria bacterium]